MIVCIIVSIYMHVHARTHATVCVCVCVCARMFPSLDLASLPLTAQSVNHLPEMQETQVWFLS